MSYNNFSYFNGPTTPTQWWGPPNSVRPSFDKPIIPQIPNPQIRSTWPKTVMTADYNNQPFNQSPVSSFPQSMILPSENRPAEPAHPIHEVKQGTVTQLFSNFGYINDNIIFSKTDVIGQMVQVGDKVAVDTTFQPNNPTNYKGERVCKIDESRFMTVTNANMSKMKTLSQGSSSRSDIPIRNRLDYSYDHRETSPRTESSIKSRLDYKYDTREPSPRSESTIKSRLDYKYDARDKSPRADTSIKSRLEPKFDSATRPKEKSSSHKGSTDSKSSKSSDIKDRLTIDKEKAQPSLTTVSKKKTAKKFDLLRKEESIKRKAIKPITFNESPKPVTTKKRKSDSKSKLVSKNYENFALRELDCAAVKNQCRTLTLPKEFFHVSLKYQQSFPLNHPMKMGNNCHFKIMDKKVRSIDNFGNSKNSRSIDPEDADTTFVAKVMLLSTDDLAKFYKDTLTLAEEFDGENKIPITKAIKFLVGSFGEEKEFGIGGAWSPSLDGTDPETNPRVLINTAIRTCRAITGIDLSNCSSWPKFLELHYYRPLQKVPKKMKLSTETVIDVDMIEEGTEYKEPRMETVVYYIPDVWNCVPSQDSWNEMTRLYQEQLTCLMCPPPGIPARSTTTTTATPATASSIPVNDSDTPTIIEDNKAVDGAGHDEEDWNFNETETSEENVPKNSDNTTGLEEQATHYSKLVVSGMKIVDIKKELQLRKLNNRGVMEQLKARLKASLEREETEEKNKGSSDVPSVVTPATTVKEAPKSNLTEEQKTELKKLYTLPDQPHVIVHQNRRLFGSQSKLRTMSLHSLLSYNNVALQESTFELALFAKQFLDMLRRDAVFNIYKSIVMAPEADLINVEDSDKKAKLMVTTSKRTINRPLLFSCSLLDREKTNQISLENLKILIEGLGICLSSDQLLATLEKVKDKSKYLNYRQLTDKEMTDSDISNLLNLDVSEDLDYIKELAMGNKALFESEEAPTESSMNDEEMERVKNELDKSERCRQSIELKVAEMKEETEKNINLVQTYIKEMSKLKEQVTEYRTKYHSEKDRSEYYKKDFEKMLRYMKEVDKLSASLHKYASDSVQKYTTDNKKTSKEKSIVSKSKSEKSVENFKKVEGVVAETVILSTDSSKDTTIDVEMKEKVEENPNGDHSETKETDGTSVVQSLNTNTTTLSIAVNNSGTNAAMEDFELSKPSDYDMIILDEAE